MRPMKRLAVALALLALSACDPPTAPSRTLVQCCESVHKCYVPEAGVPVCRAGYTPIWGQR